MGKSKRKLFTSMTAFALVAVMSVGAVIVVFASLMAHVESSFNISYTASNVECIVTGTYTQRYGLQNQSLGSPIVFTAEAPDNDTREFNVIPDINFENSEDYLEFHFSIQNTGKNGFNVSIALENFNDPNFKVEYIKAVRATGNTTPKFDFSKNVRTKFVDSYVTANGSAKEYLDIGVRISLVGKPETKASANGTFNFNLNGLAERPTDIWDDGLQKFDKENFENMLKLISADGDASAANMGTINRLATEVTDSSEIFNLVGGIKKQGNVIVTLGGLTWHACYLSRAKGSGEADGDVILTLWLTSSQQDAWQGLPADEGAYYGFIDGSLYSDWSANWTGDKIDTGVAYPTSMYGTSYVRAVTLNNGGEFATSGTTLANYVKTNDSVFALFTMENFGLTKYIVTPRQVSWQEYGQSGKDSLGFTYNMSNENWQLNLSDEGFYNAGFNYSHKEKSDVWADDYLWLPSMTETGNSGTNGLWQLDLALRKNGSFTATTSVGQVGQASGEAYANSWARSSDVNDAPKVYRLEPSGSGGYTKNSIAYSSYAIRPALHLNLTAAARALNG